MAGLAGTIWGPRYYGQTAWAVPDDLWATLVAAQRMLHLDLAGLYTPPTNLVSFPGTALILVPVAALIDAAGLPLRTGADIQLRAGSQIGNHAEWLILGPCVVILSAVALFAADALAERMAVSQFKRFLLAAAGATALWNVTIRWGHPEDAVAVGLLLYAVLALANGKPGRAAWLAGAAVAVQPLVLLAFPFLLVTVEPRRLAGFVTRTVVPTVVLLGAAAAANWPATFHAVTSQPNAPTVDHPTPWIYLTALAPHLSNGSVAAGPARALSIVVACGCALATWRRWRPAPAGRLEPGYPAGTAVVGRLRAGASFVLRTGDGLLLRLAAAGRRAGGGVAELPAAAPGRRRRRGAHLPVPVLVAEPVGVVDADGRRPRPHPAVRLAAGIPVSAGAGAARAGGAVRRRQRAMRRSPRPTAA